jgi:hypothetical protein
VQVSKEQTTKFEKKSFYTVAMDNLGLSRDVADIEVSSSPKTKQKFQESL